MPGYIGDQGNFAQFISTIQTLQQQVQALQVQIQFLASGGAFNLPTSDPHVVGRLWNDSGTVIASAG